MGTYVAFIRCPPDGPLAQIVTHIEGYRAYYVGVFAADGDPAVLELIDAVAERGVDALTGLTPTSYPVVDRWVSEFYGFYCDSSAAPPLPTVKTSMLHLRRYRQLHEEIAGQLTAEVSALWRYIYIGRPVAPASRAVDYISDDDASWVAWWSLAEVRLLRQSLPSSAAFGQEDMTEAVLAAMHVALKAAEDSGCGLVVTAF